MNKIKSIILAVMLLLSSSAFAQFRQDRSIYEYMFKWEAGYAPFVSNLGNPGEYNFYINDLRHMAGVNLINGVCIKQDFYLGVGLGYDYVVNPSDLKGGWHSGLAFIDFDFRPLDMEWSPMVYAKGGAHYMMGKTPYGNTITPYLEVGLGANWYYNYVLSNMERNYHSLFFELGIAYTQQTVVIPFRIGMRF